MNLKPGSFTETTWSEVKNQVKKLDHDLFNAIENIQLDNSYKLYLAEYAYGAPVIDEHGIFNIQINDEMIPLNSSKMAKSISQQLSYHYHGIPLGLVLKGQLQLSAIEKNKMAYPEVLFEQGDLCAIQAAIDLPNKYQATYYFRMHAGARTAYLLPSIANRRKFLKLQKKFDLAGDVPETQVEHWSFFRELANSPQFETAWTCKCLFFGKKFVEKLLENKDFYMVLSQRALRGSVNARNNTVDRMFDELALSIRNKKVDRYVLNMARYILRASLGDKISYKLAYTSDDSGPFQEISDVLKTIYDLDRYAPLIVVPQHYDRKKNHCTYVSIQMPAIDCERKYNSKNNYLMADFREIMNVVEKFIASIKLEVINEVPLYNFNDYAYNFYTADADKGYATNMHCARDIFNGDPNFEKWSDKGEVDVRNNFMRACVRIK